MNNYKIKVNIEIVESIEPVSETPKESIEGIFELIIDPDAAQSIDDCEQYLLETNYLALRAVLSKHLETVAKKHLLAMAPEEAIITKKTDYRVDGEIGRFSFPIYEIVEPEFAKINNKR